MKDMPQSAWLPALSGSSVQLLLQFGIDHGLSGDRCLAGTGIEWRDLADAAFVASVDQELQLIRNLARALGHLPGAAIQLGLRYRLAVRGVWGYALLSCATLRDAMGMAYRYQSLWNPLTDYRVEEEGDLLTTTIDDSTLPDDVRSFVVDRDIGTAISFMRDLIGTTIPALSVALRRAEPVDTRPYEELFGVKPVFGAEANKIVRNVAGFLDRRLPGANTEVLRECEAQCRALLAKRKARDGLSGELRNRMLARPGPLPDMEMLAQQLHMSLRTLRRRLADEGTSFRQLQDEVREALAEELLAEGLKVEHVAATLGYEQVSNFIRAYRRWRGVTPNKDRLRSP